MIDFITEILILIGFAILFYGIIFTIAFFVEKKHTHNGESGPGVFESKDE